MGKTVEENLPRNPQEAARMPDPGRQVNRVVVLEAGPKPLPEPTRKFVPQPIDDDKMGTR